MGNEKPCCIRGLDRLFKEGFMDRVNDNDFEVKKISQNDANTYLKKIHDFNPRMFEKVFSSENKRKEIWALPELGSQKDDTRNYYLVYINEEL